VPATVRDHPRVFATLTAPSISAPARQPLPRAAVAAAAQTGAPGPVTVAVLVTAVEPGQVLPT
jgi:biotin carboxylase